MPPKKASAKKKKEAKPAEEAPKAPVIPIKENLIKLQFKLLNWNYLNFTHIFKEDTYVFTLKKMLREYHGKMEDITLCLHSFNENNEIKNDMLTLKELGLKSFPCSYVELTTQIKRDNNRSNDTNTNTESENSTGIIEKSEIEREKELEEESIPVYQIFYEFKPSNTKADPIFLYS